MKESKYNSDMEEKYQRADQSKATRQDARLIWMQRITEKSIQTKLTRGQDTGTPEQSDKNIVTAYSPVGSEL